MRATQAVHSAQPGGHGYMGWWGNFGGPKQRWVIQYGISPYRVKPMKGAFKHWATNGFKRTALQAPYFVVPFAAAYAIIQWADHDNHIRNSKQGILEGKHP
ncbi:cytochrome b-c1 complex subunit 8 [Atractiella rhizophila]|nr:cytochrome b-c1 complex subunit 8 [Atractiella rhizophila]